MVTPYIRGLKPKEYQGTMPQRAVRRGGLRATGRILTVRAVSSVGRALHLH